MQIRAMLGKLNWRDKTRGKKSGAVNNTWFRYAVEHKTVLVFVHGLFSNADGCWKGGSTSWPQVVGSDITFDHCNIFLGGYHTSATSGRYDVAQCALELFSALETKESGRSAVVDHPNILFVCHSLGGIVCRRILEQNQARFAETNVGLILMASPTLGSGYAKTFAGIARFYGHRVAAELLPMSEALRDIDNRFRQLLQQRTIKQLVGAEAVEQHGPIRLPGLPNLLRPIVIDSSASRYFGAERIIPTTNHFTIVKPDKPTHDSHKFLVHFYQSQFSAIETKRQFAQVARSGPALQDLVLFDIYTPAARDYYIERRSDSAVGECLDFMSVWLSGPSGVGKTSLARRYAEVHKYRPVEITLSHLPPNPTKDMVFREIYETLSAVHGTVMRVGNTAFSCAVDLLLTTAATSALAIIVDEVPVSDGSVAQAIADLLDAVKRRGYTQARFLVCSIVMPASDRLTEKAREQFTFPCLDFWSDAELAGLLAKIETYLPEFLLSDLMQLELILAARGSPRFIKTFFRNLRLLNKLPPSAAYPQALKLTKDGLKGL